MRITEVNRSYNRFTASESQLRTMEGEETSLMGASTNDYIPFFSLFPLPYLSNSPFSPRNTNTFQMEMWERIKDTVHYNYKSAIANNSLHFNNRGEFKAQVKYALDTLIIPYIKKNDFIYKVHLGRSHGGASYEDIFSNLKYGMNFTSHAMRTAYFITNRYFLAHKAGNVVNVIGTLVFKREYLEYIKLCMILGEEIDPSILEFWLLEDFDTKSPKDSKYPNMRSAYRRSFKNHLIELGVPIIEKSNFKELFYSIEQPKFPAISDYKKWLDYSAAKFTYMQRKKLSLTGNKGFFNEDDKFEIRRKPIEIVQSVPKRIEKVSKEEEDLAFVVINETGLVETNNYELPPTDDGIMIQGPRRIARLTYNGTTPPNIINDDIL